MLLVTILLLVILAALVFIIVFVEIRTAALAENQKVLLDALTILSEMGKVK